MHEGAGTSVLPPVPGHGDTRDWSSDGADGGDGWHQGGRRRRKRGKRRILKATALGFSLIVLTTAGAGWVYYQHLNGNLSKDDLTLGGDMADHKPNAAGQTPLNILMIGSDSRRSKENQDLGGARAEADRPPLADVQMLLHISADRSNASVISIPRDTRVDIPECKDTDDGRTYAPINDTINSTLGRGGPGCTVATWYQLTGITIDHFMMIDFAGVVSMADAVGGVPVCVNANVRDPDSGLQLTRGDQVVKGKQALQWLRTRHAFGDGSDIGRTHAQHLYLNSMVRRLKSQGTLTNPGAMMGLAEAATNALTVDRGIDTVKKLYDLGNQMRGVPTNRLTMATMPWIPDPANPAHILPKPREAEQVFSMIRDDVPLDGKGSKDGQGGKRRKPAAASPSSGTADAAPEADIAVTVLNGSPTPGRASGMTGSLRAKGFTRAANGLNAPQQQAQSTIAYPAGNQQAKADAFAVAGALHMPTSAVRESPAAAGVTLTVGTDWPRGSDYREVLPEGGPGGLPASAGAQKADDKSTCQQVNVPGGYSW